MEMEIDYNIQNLIEDLNDIDIFSDQDEYLKLHNAFINEINYLEISEILEQLHDTYKRYKRYLNIIEFTNNSIYIKKYIIKFIKKYHNPNFNEKQLIDIMKKIDSFILDTIHDNNQPVFWLDKI